MRYLVPMLLVSLSAAQDPPPQAERPPDPTERERQANLLAYERDYLTRSDEWRQQQRGRWLVIAHGVVLPRQGDELLPAATLTEADTDATKNFPKTAHRFVIRIGDEGDRAYRIGMAPPFAPLAGTAFLRGLGQALVHAGGVAVRSGGLQVEVGTTKPDGGAYLEPELSAPRQDTKTARSALLVSNIFTGEAALAAATAAQLDLANWEMPGIDALYPGYKDTDKVEACARCRRVWLRVGIAKLGLVRTVAVAVWPSPPTPEGKR